MTGKHNQKEKPGHVRLPRAAGAQAALKANIVQNAAFDILAKHIDTDDPEDNIQTTNQGSGNPESILAFAISFIL